MNTISGDVLPRWPGFGCRLHGERCRVPWGYDEQHTDSSRPYTLDEIAERATGPHRYAYPTVGDYEQGWALWRALQRDSRPTAAEADVAYRMLVERVVQWAVADGTDLDVDDLLRRAGVDA